MHLAKIILWVTLATLPLCTGDRADATEPDYCTPAADGPHACTYGTDD